MKKDGPTRTERAARLAGWSRATRQAWPLERPQNGSSLSTGHSKRKKKLP